MRKDNPFYTEHLAIYINTNRDTRKLTSLTITILKINVYMYIPFSYCCINNLYSTGRLWRSYSHGTVRL